MPGSYKGHIVDCDAGAVGANNTPLVKVVFKLETGDKVTWTGWFSDKVNEKTGKTYTELVVDKLVSMGFSGKCVSEMSSLERNVPTLFDTNKVWDLEIDYQTDKDGKILEYFEVKWINDPEKQGTSKLDHVNAVTVFRGMKLGGLLTQAKKNAPARVEAKQEIEVNQAAKAMPTPATGSPKAQIIEKELPAHTGSDLTMDDIPF